ncbi:unnamed protein product [Paramecium sonneborni]|uniref:Uncharacterized protein n=1 Tax=Paramecium sonneborni TaxID=65129 RepID=A0A8S1N323_9CILI|nr:unnamed protein product [Paramecium sonneborni]
MLIQIISSYLTNQTKYLKNSSEPFQEMFLIQFRIILKFITFQKGELEENTANQGIIFYLKLIEFYNLRSLMKKFNLLINKFKAVGTRIKFNYITINQKSLE